MTGGKKEQAAYLYAGQVQFQSIEISNVIFVILFH